MKTVKCKSLFLMMLLLMSNYLFSQEKTKKELKLVKKMEQQRKIDQLMASRNFQFVANRALPMGYSSIDLTTNPNYIHFSPRLIKSEMPFFGRATGALPYGGGDGGLQFEGVPTNFTLEKGKKGYELNAGVRGKNDTYKIQLTVYADGGATLMIKSNSRASISYLGAVSEPKQNTLLQ
ncbi:MAG: DUF4251 domain-containing protein [Flavobacterium sp.]